MIAPNAEVGKSVWDELCPSCFIADAFRGPPMRTSAWICPGYRSGGHGDCGAEGPLPNSRKLRRCAPVLGRIIKMRVELRQKVHLPTGRHQNTGGRNIVAEITETLIDS
jgi:hypothetical protein